MTFSCRAEGFGSASWRCWRCGRRGVELAAVKRGMRRAISRLPSRGGAAVGVALLLAATCVGVGAADAPAAQTTPTTFGADLATRAPQSTATCETLYAQPTCTISTSADALGGTGETFVVPQGPDAAGSGTITAFHLAVGASTGPMQILLLQALRQNTTNPAACCSVVNATPVFTPTANTINTIPVRWATEADNTPNPITGVIQFDLIAISVSAGVALPVAPQANAVDTFWAPACPPTAGTECDVYGGDERYVVTMSADWTPDPGTANPNPNPPNPNPPAAHPVPNLLPGTAPGIVRGNHVEIPLACATALCIGRVQLQNFDEYNIARAAARGQTKTRVTYAAGSVRLAAGTVGTAKLKLNEAGRQLLHGRRQARVWLNATLRGGRNFSERITIRAG